MEITINQPPDSQLKLIPVASEQIKDGGEKVTVINCDGMKYKVIDRFTFDKGGAWPKGFMHIVMGNRVSMETIWKKYPKSDYLFVFVTEPMDEEAVVVKPGTNAVPKMMD